MKKIIVDLLITAILLTTLTLPLTSCSQTSKLLRMDEDERAEYFYRLVNSTADLAASGSMEQTMSMKLDIGDVSYEQTTEGTITFIAEQTDLTYLEQVKTTILTDGEKIVIYEDRGYADGMMFTYYKDGKDSSKLRSPITAEEYNAFMAELSASSPETRVGEDYCATMTCVQNEDKTWTATYEDFTDEGMKPFLRTLDGIEYTVTADHALIDVRLTCEADKYFYPTTMKIEYLFEENKEAETRVPEISIVSVYKGWNNTVLSEPYDTADFTEVEDLRFVERFIAALRDRETAKEGHFSVTNKTDVRYIGGESDRIEMIGDITYKNRDGMEVTVTYEEEGYKYEMEYDDGAMRVVVRDAETDWKLADEDQSMTDSDAQSMIAQFMNSESISGVDIVDVKQMTADGNTYRYTLGDAVGNRLGEIYEAQFGGTQTEFEGYIDATLADGKLMAYTYHVFNSLKIGALTLYINVDMTVEFYDVVEGGEAV